MPNPPSCMGTLLSTTHINVCKFPLVCLQYELTKLCHYSLIAIAKNLDVH